MITARCHKVSGCRMVIWLTWEVEVVFVEYLRLAAV